MQSENSFDHSKENNFSNNDLNQYFKVNTDTLNTFNLHQLGCLINSKSFWLWSTIGTLAALGFGLIINGNMCLFTGKVKKCFSRLCLGFLIFGVAFYWCLGILIKKAWNTIDNKYEGNARILLKVALVFGVLAILAGISCVSAYVEKITLEAAQTSKVKPQTLGTKPKAKSEPIVPVETAVEAATTLPEIVPSKTAETPASNMAEMEMTFDTPLGNNPIIKDPLSHKNSFLVVLQCIGESFVDFTMDENYLNKMNEENIAVIVEEILDYRYEHNQIPDELQYAFGLFWTDDSTSEYQDIYKSLKKSFVLKKDMVKKVWLLECEKGLFSKQIDGVIYLDIQGELAEGVVIYAEDDDTLYPVYEVINFGTNIEVEGWAGRNTIKNAVYVKVLLEEEVVSFGTDTIWRDLDSMLYRNKNLTGAPAYFVRADDPNLP